MSVFFYKFLHLFGFALLALAFGGASFLSSDEKQKNRKKLFMFHGIGLLIIFVAGFGLIAKLKTGFAPWVIAKIILWLALGGLMGASFKKPHLAKILWAVVMVLFGSLIYLGVFKPSLNP